ncbi:DegT/DnrJ/EryC1/StrS family aminotransferase [Pyrobaculum aerophilum]|uniref:Pleiotropic regulatory protein, conjectural n=2 Tax=Pyrobaculum aerophilum TaxID=13773 RepID=Q8ZVZ3_PYRAE|nr:DegT/DnrJ/EryC1/StrS family aminotransferase [Pyrobaculum aerophilum]AAL63911.1 pleiotropic regulatory protein, conjectural [Pyrobaculum aerophilum str. IM2]RFA93918.1 DegT/DnrJ/EryC1/StrS family aminotransferase [Pyrobaculum aerophilum]RFA96109.1 DegT/DnrJ/EryC1/StrS family aminotransferase [Pyrobaculum aerophilum]HII46522.1 DegT/DnrJ/EryC1/StrS family aminotransferase [Pyrobaculum aerophilum]
MLAIEGGKPVRETPIVARPAVYSEEVLQAIAEVLKSGVLTAQHGKWVKAFEAELASYLGVRYAAAVSNGTTALHTALKAIGVGPGDEVITTPFTFAASATAVLHANAVPVFADIDRETLNLDPASVEERITDKTKAVVVVHLAGMPAEMDQFMKLAERYGVKIIEDAAQALGAEYRGRRAGSIGHVSAFSFYATKHITSGEGGAVATDIAAYAERAKLIRAHGEVGKYSYELLGYNYRMTEIQGVLAYYQLKQLPEMERRREAYVKALLEELAPLEGDLITVPRPRPYMKHAWHLVQILLAVEKLKKPRDYVVEALRAEGVGNAFVAYPVPLYKTPLFQRQEGHGLGCPWTCPYYKRRVEYKPLPNAEWAAERVVSLLVMPNLTEQDALDTAAAFKKVLSHLRR